MATKDTNQAQLSHEKNGEIDYKPLVDLFALLFEWEIEDRKKESRENNSLKKAQ